MVSHTSLKGIYSIQKDLTQSHLLSMSHPAGFSCDHFEEMEGN